jgi:pimeloyl-ACP methyl ester carboxylesterase
MMIEQRSVKVGSAAIAYRVAGNGPPVILVHGLAGSSRWWARNITHLAQSFQVYAIDLIGFGESRGRRPFNLDEAADHVANWMDSLGITRASLIGHSMGGFIVANLAADFPGHVERLTLVGAAAVPLNRRFPWQTLGPVRGLFDMSFTSFSLLLTDAYRAGPATIWKAARDLGTADITDKLSSIQAPTLVIWGEHDPIIPLRAGKRITGILPNAELVVIRDAGHNVMWDRPEAFNQAVMDFLTGESGNRHHRS